MKSQVKPVVGPAVEPNAALKFNGWSVALLAFEIVNGLCYTAQS